MSDEDRRARFLALVEILKQRLSRQVLALTHREREPRLFDLDLLEHAALAAKRKTQLAAANRHMSIAQRRQAM